MNSASLRPRVSGTLTQRLGFTVAVAALSALLLAPSAGATPIVVDATTDVAANDDDCTLREAITAANSNTPSSDTTSPCPAGEPSPDVDEIRFATAIVDDLNAANRTIGLGSALPAITEVVAIQGCALATAQPPTQPCIGINGVNTSTLTFAAATTAPGVEVRDIAFGNAFHALAFAQGSGDDAVVQNNWFGFTLAGASNPMQQGVVVNADSAEVGGPNPGDRNVFGNISAGLAPVALIVAGDDNTIAGNRLGVAPNGTSAASNASVGILVRGLAANPATGNTIGGTQPTPGTCSGPCNVIANNASDGIVLQQATEFASGTTITGNFIGLDQAGGLDGNVVGINGVNAPNTTIGGAAAGQRNYIAGGVSGIEAAAQGAPGLEIRNNFVGLNTAGDAPQGQPTSTGIFAVSDPADPMVVSGNRVAVTAAAVGILASLNGAPVTSGGEISDNVVGLGVGNEDLGTNSIGIRATGLDAATIDGNTLTNFSFAGISVEDSDDNIVTANMIGTDASGGGEHADPGANAAVLIDDNPTPSTGNLIGGNTPATENVMSNLPNGIIVRAGDNDDNSFGRNRGSNSGVFIDLGEDGAGNEGAQAPNNSIDAPTMTSATDDVVAGGGAVANAEILVFVTPDTGSPTDIASFAGAATASAAGAWQVPVNIANAARVTALQTDPSGDSSELSTSAAAVADPPETTITGGPRKRSRLKRGKRRKRVTFRFVSSEAGEGGFQCQIDNRAFVRCDAGSFSRRVRRGRHTFRVRAFDDASNADPTLAVRSFRILRPKR